MLVLFCFVVAISGLEFFDPPEMAVGPIHSTLMRQLYMNVDTSVYNTNVSVKIIPDYCGCDTTNINQYRGKVVWYADCGCAGVQILQDFPPMWTGFQNAGALGIIITDLSGFADFAAAQNYK
jgi:hypothetical protein